LVLFDLGKPSLAKCTTTLADALSEVVVHTIGNVKLGVLRPTIVPLGQANFLVAKRFAIRRTRVLHGEPLGDEEIRLTKRNYGWPEDAKFLVPDGVYEHFEDGIGTRGADSHRKWAQLFEAYRVQYPELAAEIEQMQRRE